MRIFHMRIIQRTYNSMRLALWYRESNFVLLCEIRFLAGKNDPLNIKTQSIEDTLVTEKQPQSTNKPLESYIV